MNENVKKYFLYGFLVLAVGALIMAMTGFSFSGDQNSQSAATTISDKQSAGTAIESGFKSISTGSTGSGDALIELTPHKVSDGKMVVDASLNTHSVTLSDFDLKQITTLEYDGKSIKPSSAFSLRGHHNSGELVFDVEQDINAFAIRIRGIPKVEDRVFEWK